MQRAAILGALVWVFGCGGEDVAIGGGDASASSSSGTGATGADGSETGADSTPTASGDGTLDGTTSGMVDDSTDDADTATTGMVDGSTDDGTTGDGTTDSGSTDDGTTGGSTGAGSTDSGSTDSGSTDSGSTGAGSTDSSSSSSSSSSSDSGSSSSSTGAGMTCGNDTIEGSEVCDGADLGGDSCSSLGFDGGVLDCESDCSALDTTGCYDYGGDCCANNGTPGCDDAGCTASVCAADSTCCTMDWDATCASAAVDDSACQDVGGSCPSCGDDTAEGTEFCDGADLGGNDCISEGFDGGTLGCATDCSAYDTSGCYDYGGDCCANNGTPGCDDAGCLAAVCALDSGCCDTAWDGSCATAALGETACIDAGGTCPVCGDATIEGAEVCDTSNVAGQDCTDFGFDGGTLGCATDCQSFDLSICQDVGFGDCVNNPPATVCLPAEQCVTDLAVPPTVGVCTDPICTSVAQCPLAPPGGTAVVVCTDVTGEGINECIIDCSTGATCPTGMVCSLGLACAWPAP